LRTLQRSGRFRWETHGRTGITPDVSKLTATNGRLMVKVRITCAFPTEDKGAVFASFCRPFPDHTGIPPTQPWRSPIFAHPKMNRGAVH
jgi:hypothetical protein